MTTLNLAGQHPIILRGGAATLWNHIARAIDEGVEPPPEIMLKGPAGTGKSFGALATLLSLGKIFPNVPGRVLIIRLTRKSLTTSACVTIRKVLHPTDPALEGANDGQRTEYKINAWTYALGTLDNIDNYLSAEWDFCFLDEARQAELEQWELLAGRGIRNNAFFHYDFDGNRVPPHRRGIDSVAPIPFGICVGSTNPWKRKSWFNTRAGTPTKPGPLLLIQTRLEENPGYASPDENGVLVLNQEGASYRARMARTNSGTRYRRLVLGEDCSAEGMIYEEWNGDPEHINKPDGNLVRTKRDSEGRVLDSELERLDVREFFCGADFGDAAPGVLRFAGLTGKGALVVLYEVYARRKDPKWFASFVLKVHRWHRISLGFCDHQQHMVNLFNDTVSAPREGPDAIFVKAEKGPGSVLRGIQIQRMRIKERRFLVDVDALMHPPDPLCIEDGIPWQGLDEVDGYVWKREDDEDQPSSDKREDIPDPRSHDHAMDADRYMSVGVEHMDPARKRWKPIDKKRGDYLKGLYILPGGKVDEESLAEDMAEMQDEEADFLDSEMNRLAEAEGGDLE